MFHNKPFYTPIFDREWVRRCRWEDEKKKREKGPEYVPDPDAPDAKEDVEEIEQ